MMAMKTTSAGLLALATFLVSSMARAEADPRAVAVGKSMWTSLGGDSGWNRARYFRFDFVVEAQGKKIPPRAHYWDRFTGRYRQDGTDKTGNKYSAFFNVNTRAGQAFVNGKKLEEAEAKTLIDKAYGGFINDTYWLLAPYKIFDPGVNLAYDGQVKGPHGETCDVLKLSFESVGLTPKDVYWFHVDRATHMMSEWKYVLGGHQEPPTTAVWDDWKEMGGIRLSATKTMKEKPVAIRFENLAVAAQPNEAALTPPASP